MLLVWVLVRAYQMSCGYVEMSCEYVDMWLQHLAQITTIWFWKHLAFAIIIDEIELDLHHLGNNLQMQHHTLSESRQPIANAFPTPMEHHVSNEAGGPSSSSLSYGMRFAQQHMRILHCKIFIVHPGLLQRCSVAMALRHLTMQSLRGSDDSHAL